MKKAVLGVFATVFMLVSAISCKHTKEPGVAEIQVISADGVAQKNVKVTMYCTEPTCVVRREGTTNELGVYTEEFELPVVLRARSVRYDTTITYVGNGPSKIKKVHVDSLCGEGFIQVENDEVASETITILTCN